MSRLFKPLSFSVFLGIAFFGSASPAFSEFVTVFNTGVDGTGALLPLGASDPNWSLVAGPGITSATPAIVLTTQSPFGLYATSPNSQWVWAQADGSGLGPYTFQLTFDLTGLDLSTVMISGSWGIDNNGYISLNGSTTGIGTGALSLSGSSFSNFQTFNDFTLDNGFVSGVNTLDFVVTNDPGGTGGLNVTNLVATGSPELSTTPEPSSLALGSIGAFILLGCRALRWKRPEAAAAPQCRS
jgi:hypothetical protein